MEIDPVSVRLKQMLAGDNYERPASLNGKNHPLGDSNSIDSSLVRVPNVLQRWKEEGGGRFVDLIPASSVRMEQTRWAWKDRIPLGGVTLLAGQEGSGKTTILVDVLARATRGQLDGDLRGEPVGCVYATAEDSHSRTLAPRLFAAGADLNRVFFIEIDGLAGGLSIPGDIDALDKRMRQTGSRVLVLDPLGAHLGGTLDTHRDASVRQALAPLASHMDRIGGACVGVMHWSKAPTTVALDRVNGSRGFTAAARAMLAVGEDPEDKSARVLILAKSNLGRIDVPALKYRIEGREILTDDGLMIITSGVAWLGEAPGIGVHDIFTTVESTEERTERDELEAVINDAMNKGCQDIHAVKAAVKDAGFDASSKTIQRVLTRMGVTRRPEGFGGKWILQRPQSGQMAPVTQKPVHTVQTEDDQGFVGASIVHTGQSGQSGRVIESLSRADGPPPPDDALFLDDEHEIS
jgi:hypothetical protein